MTEVVLSTLENGVRTITLNRPEKLNAMNGALIAETCQAFADANRDDDTRVIIFTGAGKAFCAGDDLTEESIPQSEDKARRFIDDLQQVTREMILGPKIVVGAINGWAVGGGFEWAIDCDLALWAESARGFFPETSWGLFVTGAVTSLLPRMVGAAKAKEMLLLGEKYGAQELLELGVAWKVVADDQLMATARDVAQRIAAQPARAVADIKRSLARVNVGELETALHLETEALLRAIMDPETHKRIATFGKG
jgi:enoyl-CoA hydratase/carnithine racemase